MGNYSGKKSQERELYILVNRRFSLQAYTNLQTSKMEIFYDNKIDVTKERNVIQIVEFKWLIRSEKITLVS